MPLDNKFDVPRNIQDASDKLFECLNEVVSIINQMAERGYVVQFQLEGQPNGGQKLVQFKVLTPLKYSPVAAKAN